MAPANRSRHGRARPRARHGLLLDVRISRRAIRSGTLPSLRLRSPSSAVVPYLPRGGARRARDAALAAIFAALEPRSGRSVQLCSRGQPQFAGASRNRTRASARGTAQPPTLDFLGIARHRRSFRARMRIAHLGLYGAFGYDLVFQFEPIVLQHERVGGQRDLVLYLPDDLPVVDHKRETAFRSPLPVRLSEHRPVVMGRPLERTLRPPVIGARSIRNDASESSDHAPGEFAATVRLAQEAFRRGDLFEVTPSQTFHSDATAPPSDIFRRLRSHEPRALWLFREPGRRRVSARGLARDVRPRHRRSGRDLPDRGHDRARQRRLGRRATRSCASSRPRKTKPSSRCARTWTATTSRASANPAPFKSSAVGKSSCTRASFTRSTTSRARFARARRARRVPLARMGGHGDGRAQASGHAVHRGSRESAAGLVRGRRRASSDSTEA